MRAITRIGQVRSGQVRVFTCTFRASCCSARLSRAHVPLSRTGRKKRGERVRGDRLLWRVQGSTSSLTGIGSRRRRVFEVLWNLECPVGLSQKRNTCAFQWSSVVRAFAHGTMGRSFMVDPLELFLVPASAPRLVYQRPWYVLSSLWDGAYKRTVAANLLCGGSGFPLSLSEWSFTICHNAI